MEEILLALLQFNLPTIISIYALWQSARAIDNNTEALKKLTEELERVPTDQDNPQ